MYTYKLIPMNDHKLTKVNFVYLIRYAKYMYM